MNRDNEISTYVSGQGRCRIMYEEISPERIFVHGIFRIIDDGEVDFVGLPLDIKDFILSECRKDYEKRKQNKN